MMNIFSYLFSKYISRRLPEQSHLQPHQAVSSRMPNRSREDLISTLSSRLNLANFPISSGVLDQSWVAITETKVHFKDQLSGSDLTIQFQVKELTKYNILVFVTPPVTRSALLQKTELVTSSKESTISDFDFLQSTRKKSKFSINKAALSLLGSRKKELLNLVDEITKAANSKPYIITGDGIGGSVASLFALQLFSSLDTTKTKLPLCITFGSPLLGDSGLQKAISGYTTWNSCFLHVVSMDDCFPSLFVRPNREVGGQTTGHTSTYHPFGRFMLCSNSGGACFDDSESALILLEMMGAGSEQNEDSFDYGSITASFRKNLICKDRNNLNANGTGSSAQYLARLFQLQDFGKLEKLLRNEMLVSDKKRQTIETTAKGLNDIKVYMTYMEWYKKKSEEKEIPYYDSYKNQSVKADFDVNKFKGYLQNYWIDQVKEAEQKPQRANAALRVRWLFAGTTYRRMVEPLAIAAYYKGKGKGARDYITKIRSEGALKHYEQLEEWFKKDQEERKMEEDQEEKKNVAPPSLTEDSCFWAHVEEAIISCEILSEGASSEEASGEVKKLKGFEKYVLGRIKNYEVSSDIFWEKSSFMKWWKDYEKILDRGMMGTSYSSRLVEIMHNHDYKLYQGGEL